MDRRRRRSIHPPEVVPATGTADDRSSERPSAELARPNQRTAQQHVAEQSAAVT
jgi:hypothetical protein